MRTPDNMHHRQEPPGETLAQGEALCKSGGYPALRFWGRALPTGSGKVGGGGLSPHAGPVVNRLETGSTRRLRLAVAASIACSLPGLTGSAAPAPMPRDTDRPTTSAEESKITALRARLTRLRGRVDELAGNTDLLDTLHFAWFDRPYARATLAILVKTTAVLEREERLRDRGNGAIADATVRSILTWTDNALVRVIAAQPDPRFRPHRLGVTNLEITSGSSPVPLFGFVDRSTSSRQHENFGDFDLLAAIGFRVYPRLRRDILDPDAADLLHRRAGELGMAAIPIDSKEATAPRGHSVRVTAAPRGHSARVATAPRAGRAADEPQALTPVTLHALLEGAAISAGAPAGNVTLMDPVGGESWGASLGRRALARGLSGRERFTVADWHVPLTEGGKEPPLAAITAAMWAHAFEGQSLGLLPGWRDLRDGSGSPHRSVFLDPARVETIAHTALDLIRLSRYIKVFDAPRALAVAVGSDAIDQRDDNAWATWLEPAWAALLEGQVSCDVVRQIPTATVRERQLSPPIRTATVRERLARGQGDSGYSAVLRLTRSDDADRAEMLSALERALTTHRERQGCVTARDPDGRLAVNVFVRTASSEGTEAAAPRGGRASVAASPHGDRPRAATAPRVSRACVALINLSDRFRRVMLTGTPAPGALTDVITSQRIADPAQPIDLGPWQVRLLIPAE